MQSLKNTPYVVKNGIHVRPDYSKFVYSDGDVNEQRMLEILQQTKDVSTQSEELKQNIDSWVSEYHFSQSRHNLLRGLDLENFENVLELGAGCGAITRQLGERCGQITAVDGSFQRLAVAAERCRGLSNVSFYCENIENIEAPAQFDLITMIGTLEYSPLFIQGADPVQTCLSQMAQNLTEDGVLLIAIENQLGLKYFNGCGEDHLGELFFGINDLYHKTATTFGYHELKQRILKAGFANVEFLFPFPDYKLPQLIVREAALEEESLRLGSIIGQFPGRDYQGRAARNFSERLCWLTLARNRLIPHFANSFLIVASGNQAKPVCNEDWLLKIYNLGRKSAYCTKSTFSLQKNGKCRVEKKSLFPQQKEASSFLKHVLTNEAYVPGKQLGELIAKGLLNREWYTIYLSQLKRWLVYLQQFQMVDVENETLLETWQVSPEREQGWVPGNMVDCIPRNLIDDGKEWHYVDQEWIIQTPIPIIWIVFRGILADVGDHLPLAGHSPVFKDCSIQEWIMQTMAQLGYPLGATAIEKDEMLSNLIEWEIRFRREVSEQKEAHQRDSLHLLLNEQIGRFSKNSELLTETQALKQELFDAKTSLGYRIGVWVKRKTPDRLRKSLKSVVQFCSNRVNRKK